MISSLSRDQSYWGIWGFRGKFRESVRTFFLELCNFFQKTVGLEGRRGGCFTWLGLYGCLYPADFLLSQLYGMDAWPSLGYPLEFFCCPIFSFSRYMGRLSSVNADDRQEGTFQIHFPVFYRLGAAHPLRCLNPRQWRIRLILPPVQLSVPHPSLVLGKGPSCRGLFLDQP